ncbi:MAG TPA: hypothetical protein VHE35_10600 [Kofleriaceae bacterium]|nr:hypothetical protein [Kofleriaceae bacterium]
MQLRLLAGVVVGLVGGVLASGALAACGGSDDGSSTGDDDGNPPIDATLGPCDPLQPPNQQNCEAGQRCTWVVDQAGPPSTGHLGCVADGTLPLGAACEPSAGGQPDRCTTGTVCAGGFCQDVCGFDGAAGSGCAADQSCARHANLFASGDATPFAGVCRPTCDPLTQQRTDGNPCDEGQGCYLITSASETVAVCAKAGTGVHGEDLTGPVYANSCVPGVQPRRKDSASMTAQCGGLCRAVDVTSTMARASEGGLNPDSCQMRWGAAPADDGGLGESCRYWGGRETFQGLSPYSDTVGWCFKHVAFQYDSDGDGNLDASFPRCAALTTGDVVPPIGNPPHNDAAYFWCVAFEGSRGPMITIPQVQADRVLE